MYHIWPPQCQIQLRRAESGDYARISRIRLRFPPQSARDIGAVMKDMRGQADAGRVRELILEKLA